jgi:hypothetical protein
VIYGQCNILGHFKEHCHWNPNNLNNKFKDKKEVAMNRVLEQHGGIRNKSSNKRSHKKKKNLIPSFIVASFAILLNIKFMIVIIKTQLRPCLGKRQWQLHPRRMICCQHGFGNNHP